MNEIGDIEYIGNVVVVENVDFVGAGLALGVGRQGRERKSKQPTTKTRLGNPTAVTVECTDAIYVGEVNGTNQQAVIFASIDDGNRSS